MKEISIAESIQKYLLSLQATHSRNTQATYGFAMRAFASMLSDRGTDPETTPVSALRDDMLSWFSASLSEHSPATEKVYLHALENYFIFLSAEQIHFTNLPRMRNIVRKCPRKIRQKRLESWNEEIDRVLEFADTFLCRLVEGDAEGMRNLRDRAFLLTLADTGLRVHEACNLRRGDVDWNEGRAIITGKGDKQAVVRFFSRSLRALREYLADRASLDGSSGRPLPSLPLFARHDRGAGKKVKPITTATGRNIVAERVRQALGDEATGRITPHSFRHYFVTTVLRASGNLKLAQELARHSNISVTQRYAHLSDDELDRGYHDIFE